MYCLKKEEKTKRLNNSRNISYRNKKKNRDYPSPPHDFLFWGMLAKWRRCPGIRSGFQAIAKFLEASRELNVNHVLASLRVRVDKKFVAEIFLKQAKLLRVGKRRYFRSTVVPHAHDICAITQNIKRKPPTVVLSSNDRDVIPQFPRVLSLSVYAIGKAVECL